MATDNVRGLKHFTDYFSDCQGQFVIIGGVATNFFLQEADFEGRVTKDIDLVVLANPNKPFADKLREYIMQGRYQIESDSSGNSRNYRFRKPELVEYPLQIEIFSPLPISLELRDGQQIVPFSTSAGLNSLSAILMDSYYFSLVKKTLVLRNGMPLLSVDGLILLKARAFLDLDARKQKGESIDQKEIKKHRNDVIRLTFTVGEEKFSLPDSIKNDLQTFLEHEQIKTLDLATLQSLVASAESLEEFNGLLIAHFEL